MRFWGWWHHQEREAEVQTERAREALEAAEERGRVIEEHMRPRAEQVAASQRWFGQRNHVSPIIEQVLRGKPT